MAGECRESGFIGAKSCFWHPGAALGDPSRMSEALADAGVGGDGWRRFRAESQQSPSLLQRHRLSCQPPAPPPWQECLAGEGVHRGTPDAPRVPCCWRCRAWRLFLTAFRPTDKDPTEKKLSWLYVWMASPVLYCKYFSSLMYNRE